MSTIKELAETIKKISNEDLKEVSVREEIVNPLLKLLGYESSKKNMIREAKFENIDIITGSKKQTATYQADYYCEACNHKKWILEVKRTDYKIDERAFWQAFSYATHPKINAELFAICNGRQFVLYSFQKRKKIFDFYLNDLKENYPLLHDFLAYENFDDTTDCLKDFGLYLKSQNYKKNDTFEFSISTVKFIEIVNENTIYINTPVQYDNMKFFASFMVNKQLFLSAHKFFADLIKVAQIKNEYPLSVPLYDNQLSIRFQCKMNCQMVEVEKEFYLPLTIIKFLDVTFIPGGLC